MLRRPSEPNNVMFCLRTCNTAVPSYILKSAATHAPSRSLRATSIHAPPPMLSIFGGRGHRLFGSQSSPAPESLPLGVPVDEEKIPGYEPRYFYHANPGDVLNCRYELKAKIGWGSSSTVWLARDTRSGGWLEPIKYVVVKICSCNSADVRHELDMSIHLSANSDHRGRAIVATAIESFGLESPMGSTHLSLIFEPMREPLWLFRRRVAGEDRVTPPLLPLIKTYLQILLEGLDYLHSECHVIHTDLKLDNILLTFENQSTIEAFIRGQTMHPMARKRVGNRTVYRCHNDFGRINGDDALKKMYPKISDFGLAQRGDQPGPFVHPIQPNDCHAPEVLLGTGWSYSADIWNFGAMVWDLLGGKGLFQQEDPHSYSAVQHLADMIAFLGPVPPVLVQRERDMRQWRWSPEAINPEGRLCSSTAEFYGGPFFNDDGTFVRRDLVSCKRSWRSEMPACIPEEDADRFFKFMKRMLCWLPEDRATARELKNDPWFDRLL